jgi:hypothetical protein
LAIVFSCSSPKDTNKMMRLDVELFLQKLEPSQKRGLAADLSGAIYVADVPERFWYKTANDEAINKWLTEVLNQEALPEISLGI